MLASDLIFDYLSGLGIERFESIGRYEVKDSIVTVEVYLYGFQTTVREIELIDLITFVYFKCKNNEA